MDRVRQHIYFLILFVVSLCFLHANQDNGNSGIRCASSCLKSSRCDWIVLDRDTCHANTFINYTREDASTEDDNERLLVYRKVYSGLQGNIRLTEFARINPTDMCGTPPSIYNADVNYRTPFPGSRARYICKDGFSFCGRPYKDVDCLSNGSWEELGGCIQDEWVAPAYNGTLNCPLTVGTVIEFSGVPPTGFSHFSFNLVNMALTKLIHFDVRFNYASTSHEVIADTQNRGLFWLDMKTADRFPFEYERQFNITITMNTTHYRFLVNGVHLMSYRQYEPLSEVHSFLIENPCDAIRVRFKYHIV